jgi:hypothetical protein
VPLRDRILQLVSVMSERSFQSIFEKSTRYFLLVSILLAGCTFNAPDGPPFRALLGPAEDEVLIYVYRPANETWGYDRTYYLFDSKEKLTDLLHGSYFPIWTKPGKVSLLADVNRDFRTWLGGGIPDLATAPDGAVIEIDTEPGETYYVRFHPITHSFSFEPTLTLVSSTIGLSELKDCKLLSKYQPG